MLDEKIALSAILVSLEGTLKIENDAETKVEQIVSDAIDRIENTYNFTLEENDVFALQAESQLIADNIDILLNDVRKCLSDVALFLQLKLFHKNLQISLADVNYMGYAKTQLLTSLSYLQDETEAKRHADDIIKPLHNALDNVSMCTIKRLFIIMLVLHRLGIHEGVAIIAELLYVGGLII